MFNKFAFVFLILCSFSVNADVVKWVDSEGKTHYSNTAPTQHKQTSQTIKFVNYKKPNITEAVVKPVAFSGLDQNLNNKDTKQMGMSIEPEPEAPRKSRQRKTRFKKPTIVELRAQCDIARKKRLAPARAEAIEACIEKNEAQTKNVVAYCERFYRTFGDESSGLVYHYPYGRFRHTTRTRTQRLFHNIPECRRLYKAEDHQSRLNRGYRN